MKEALTNNNLVRDINLTARLIVTLVQQFVHLWSLVTTMTLTPDDDDTIIWKLTHSSMYTAASAYRAQFFGHT